MILKKLLHELFKHFIFSKCQTHKYPGAVSRAGPWPYPKKQWPREKKLKCLNSSCNSFFFKSFYVIFINRLKLLFHFI